MLWGLRATRLGRLRSIRVVSRERVGVLGRALLEAEADAVWGAVVAEQRGLGGCSRVVGGVGAQGREQRRLGLGWILPDHGHCEAAAGPWGVRRGA